MRFTFDLAEHDENPPNAGDLLVSTRVVYRIVDIREVDSRVWCNRWRLDVRRIGLRADLHISEHLSAGERVHFSGHYREGERPAEWFARQRAEGRQVPS